MSFRGKIHTSQAYEACADITKNFKFAAWIPGRVSLGRSSKPIRGMGPNNAMHLYNHTAIGGDHSRSSIFISVFAFEI